VQRLISELGYLGLEVRDLTRWERFAADVLGLMVVPGPRPDTRWLRMDEHAYRFILSEGSADDCIFAGWKTRDAAALDEFSRHLDARGVQWSWGTEQQIAERQVERMLWLTDPAGNRHEVYCGTPLANSPFVSPHNVGRFVTRGEGLGHVVYSSGAYAATLEFAADVLGLGSSDQIIISPAPGMNFEVSFLHANSRHHSFAIAPQPPGPGPHKKIHHFMIEVANIEDVGFARDRCLAAGQPVHMDIGQHPNDKMISFYGQTPSGFFVEFGWGGVKVDPATWQATTYDRLSSWGHRPNNEVSAPPPPATHAVDGSAAAGGAWNVVIKTPLGENKVVFDLQVEGGALSGSIKAATENSEIREGRIDGRHLTWRSKVSSPIPMDLTFTASVDGDKISGGAKSPFGTAPFSGTRA
jgi:2,3-dihydroxybiphenyl 1,2-dioxygenase